MSTWNGKHGQGAMRLHREQKRKDAVERNARTPETRRRRYRRTHADDR